MIFFAWCRLVYLEQKLQFGEFGKYNRYRCWCLKQNAKNAVDKLQIAKEVLDGPGVNTMKAQYNELYIRNNAEKTLQPQSKEEAKDQPSQKPSSKKSVSSSSD